MKLFILLLAICLFVTSNLHSQDSRDDCNEYVQQIEKLLLYKDKSPKQLRTLLERLKSCSGEESTVYKQLKIRVDGNLLPVDIKLVKSDIYNKNFKEGVRKIPKLKLYYPYNDEITKLEKFVDKKLFSNGKKNLLKKKPSHISIEPSFALSTVEEGLNEFSKINTSVIHPIFGFAVYGKFNQKSKIESNSKPTQFRYSQVGLKFEYRDAQTTLFGSGDNTSIYGDYANFQVSLLLRKCLGIDLGLLNYRSASQTISNVQFYTGAFHFYIPIRFISFGISSKLISDFQNDHRVQFSLGTKLNFGVFKTFTKADREEIKTDIILLKEK